METQNLDSDHVRPVIFVRNGMPLERVRRVNLGRGSMEIWGIQRDGGGSEKGEKVRRERGDGENGEVGEEERGEEGRARGEGS